MSGSRRISSIWNDSALLPQLPGMNAGFTLPALRNTTLPSSGVSSYVHDAIDALLFLQTRLPPFAKISTRVLRALLFSLRYLSSALVLFRQTIPKRHPHVVMRPSRSWCDVSLGTIDD